MVHRLCACLGLIHVDSLQAGVGEYMGDCWLELGLSCNSISGQTAADLVTRSARALFAGCRAVGDCRSKGFNLYTRPPTSSFPPIHLESSPSLLPPWTRPVVSAMSKKSAQSQNKDQSYEFRDVVLAKIRGFPPWPGMVSTFPRPIAPTRPPRARPVCP